MANVDECRQHSHSKQQAAIASRLRRLAEVLLTGTRMHGRTPTPKLTVLRTVLCRPPGCRQLVVHVVQGNECLQAGHTHIISK